MALWYNKHFNGLLFNKIYENENQEYNCKRATRYGFDGVFVTAAANTLNDYGLIVGKIRNNILCFNGCTVIVPTLVQWRNIVFFQDSFY